MNTAEYRRLNNKKCQDCLHRTKGGYCPIIGRDVHVTEAACMFHEERKEEKK